MRNYSMSAAAVLALAVPAAVDTTEPESFAAAIPEGVYRTPELTVDQLRQTALDAGFAEDDVDAFFEGAVGTTVFGLRLADGGWTQLYSNDGGPEGVGWRGTYEVIDDDTVVATDPCGPITYTYSLEGEQLTLDMIDDQCTGAGGDTEIVELIAQTTIFETAPFTLEEPATPGAADAEPTTYASNSFVVPFEVTPPDWVAPEPAAELPNFVTWEGAEIDRGIRFLAPVNVYLNGGPTPSEVPDDYLTYLLGLSELGASFDDVVETTVDGRPATVLTATTSTSLDGSIGCQEAELMAADCFGVQPDLILRMAVMDTDAGPLLIWVRDIQGAGDRELEYDSFDEMLASLRFRGD
jgi:hypothetical protein